MNMASAQRENFNNNTSGRGTRGNPSNRRYDSYGPVPADSWAITEMDQEDFCFLWTLQNYSTMRESEEMKSPVFLGGARSKHQWQLKIHPKKILNGIGYFGLYLALVGFGDGDDTPSRKIKVRFQISLLTSEGEVRVQNRSACMSPLEYEKGKVWGYEKFLPSSELLNSSRRLTTDDTLRIHLRAWIVKGLKHKSFERGAGRVVEGNGRSYRGIRMLAFDMGNLFKREVVTDIKVRTDTGTFKAHKHVLAARSPFFAAMFAFGLDQKTPNEICINGFDNDVVQDMLEYLYTGEAQLVGQRASDLLKLAEKYDLTELKESCESVLVESVSIENSAALLLLAHGNKAKLLKSRVIWFINRHYGILKDNQELKDILQDHSDLAMELYLAE